MIKRSLNTESELLHMVANDDEVAFRTLFDLYSGKLHDYVLRITRDEDLSEEIVMDAFLKVWNGRLDLLTINKFDAYLYTIVRNQAFNAIKRIAHEARIIKELSYNNTEYGDCTEQTVIYNNYRQLLNHAVNKLPPQQKRVFMLSREEGMKYDEIALEMNLSKNTVKAHLKKAVVSLRTVLSNYMIFSICPFLWP